MGIRKANKTFFVGDRLMPFVVEKLNRYGPPYRIKKVICVADTFEEGRDICNYLNRSRGRGGRTEETKFFYHAEFVPFRGMNGGWAGLRD